MKTTKCLCIALASASVLLAGCASVHEGSTTARQESLAFTPPPGKAGIYIIRKDRIAGAAAKVCAAIDAPGAKKTVATANRTNLLNNYCILSTRSYAYFPINPGQHTIGHGEIRKDISWTEYGILLAITPAYVSPDQAGVSKVKGGSYSYVPDGNVVTINAEPGKNYFITGFLGGHAKLVSEEEGRALVTACKLSGETHFAP